MKKEARETRLRNKVQYGERGTGDQAEKQGSI